MTTAEASFNATPAREVFILGPGGARPGSGKPKGSHNNYTSSPAAQAQRENAAPVRHGLYARSQALKSYRDERVDELMAKAQELMTWLSPRHIPTLRHWAETELLLRTAFGDLLENGMVNDRGVPRRMLQEYSRLLERQRGLARELGMTPQSEAQLGLVAAGTKRAQLGIDALLARTADDAEAVDGDE